MSIAQFALAFQDAHKDLKVGYTWVRKQLPDPKKVQVRRGHGSHLPRNPNACFDLTSRQPCRHPPSCTWPPSLTDSPFCSLVDIIARATQRHHRSRHYFRHEQNGMLALWRSCFRMIVDNICSPRTCPIFEDYL